MRRKNRGWRCGDRVRGTYCKYSAGFNGTAKKNARIQADSHSWYFVRMNGKNPCDAAPLKAVVLVGNRGKWVVRDRCSAHKRAARDLSPERNLSATPQRDARIGRTNASGGGTRRVEC